MTAHFWTGAGATLGAAAMMGLGLGGYVTSPQSPTRSADDYVNAAIDNQTASDTSFAVDKGPDAIHCIGCGPTLAERRWQADMAGLDLKAMADGNADPVLRDYEAAQTPEDLMPDPPTVSVRPSPPQVVRFASGNAEPPVIATRTGKEAVPPTLVETKTEAVQPYPDLR